MNKFAAQKYQRQQYRTELAMMERRERGWVYTGQDRECRECGGHRGHFGDCAKVE